MRLYQKLYTSLSQKSKKTCIKFYIQKYRYIPRYNKKITMSDLILLEQIKEAYKIIPGLRWTVADYYKVIKNFMIMYSKYQGKNHEQIINKKMPFILKSLQTYKPYEINEMIEEFFSMQLAPGIHHTIYYFCNKSIKRHLYYVCFMEKRKRG